MSNKFDSKNKIIGLCMLGMNMEEQGDSEGAMEIFKKALNESTNDFEKFVAIYQIAKYEKNIPEKLKWFEKSLKYTIKSEDYGIKSTLPTIYFDIAKCYEELGESEKAKKIMSYQIYITQNQKMKDHFIMELEQTCKLVIF